VYAELRINYAYNNEELETVSIADPLQNRQHAQNPKCCQKYRERGKEGEVGSDGERRKEGGKRREEGR